MAQRRLTMIIGDLPDSRLNPNSRCGWWQRRDAVQTARLQAGWLAHAKWRRQPPMAAAIIDYTFTVTVERKRDADNLIAACKPWQDGIVDAGVVQGDTHNHIKIGNIAIVKGPRRQTTITITEILESAAELRRLAEQS